MSENAEYIDFGYVGRQGDVFFQVLQESDLPDGYNQRIKVNGNQPVRHGETGNIHQFTNVLEVILPDGADKGDVQRFLDGEELAYDFFLLVGKEGKLVHGGGSDTPHDPIPTVNETKIIKVWGQREQDPNQRERWNNVVD